MTFEGWTLAWRMLRHEDFPRGEDVLVWERRWHVTAKEVEQIIRNETKKAQQRKRKRTHTRTHAVRSPNGEMQFTARPHGHHLWRASLFAQLLGTTPDGCRTSPILATLEFNVKVHPWRAHATLHRHDYKCLQTQMYAR